MEPKPRTVEMAKQEILERMCNCTITGGGQEYLAFAQAYNLLDGCSSSESVEMSALLSRLSTLLDECVQQRTTAGDWFARRLSEALGWSE